MTTKWAGWVVAALALAALAAGAVYAASHSTEVRITARQLDDGRVEFALQQRVGGEWGERQLPRSRFFPADAAVGRWLNSSPLTVSVEVESDEQATTTGGDQTASSDYSAIGKHPASLCPLIEVQLDVNIHEGGWCTNGFAGEREYFNLPAGRWNIFIEAPEGCSLWLESVDGRGIENVHTRQGGEWQTQRISVGYDGDTFTPGEVEVQGYGCGREQYSDYWQIVAEPR